MSQQIDPRLYGSMPHHSSSAAPHPQYTSPGTRLPPIDQTHQLPPLAHDTPLHQPYYRLPAATTPLHHSQPPAPPHSAESRVSQYDTSPTHQGYQHDDDISHQGLSAEDAKRSRACEACRGLKVRCDRDENDPERPCKRCAKARRTCIVTAPTRKRQKKTDSRVAELEKKIDELSANLKRQRQEDGASPTSNSCGKDGRPLSPPQSTYSASTAMPTPPFKPSTTPWKRELEDRTAPQASAGHRTSISSQDRSKSRKVDKGQPDNETHMLNHRPRSSRTDESDITNSSQASGDLPLDSIVDPETAERVFDRYVAEMAQHLPAVMFDEGTTASDIRTKRPILFLAILDTASVGMLDVEVQARLNEMLLDVYATSILRNGEKSLDLIQALMVSTIWYRPPKRYEQMNVYMLTHISALMALDFGMGRKLNASRSARVAANVGQAQTPKSFLRSDSVEARRTWLGCYFVCMNVSLSLRRPNFIRWNSYLDECIKVLESAPETLPSDKRLCQHVKLMHINEEVGLRFSMDDPSATIAISDPRVQFAIGAFEKRLTDWGDAVPRAQWDLSLEFSMHYCRLYMHEVALHNNHNVDDFRAPFTEESLKAPSIPAKSLTPLHQGFLEQCLRSVHGMFNTFMSFDMVTVKALPIFYFVRIAYAVVVLIKLRAAVKDPKSELPFSEEDLQVEYHLDNLLQTFQRIAADGAFRPARMFMIIVSKLREGFQKPNGLAPPVDRRKSSNPDGNPPFAIEAGVPDRPNKVAATVKAVKKARAESSGVRSDASSQASSQQPQAQAQAPPPPLSSIQQQQQQQQQQQIQHAYNTAQTPLHFLSEVATNNPGMARSTNMPPPYSTSTSTPSANNAGWYQPQHQHYTSQGVQQQHPQMGYTTENQNLDPVFEQAMDMTMSIGEGDLSSLFIEGSYGYGAGPGLVPEGGMHPGVYGVGGQGGGGW